MCPDGCFFFECCKGQGVRNKSNVLEILDVLDLPRRDVNKQQLKLQKNIRK